MGQGETAWLAQITTAVVIALLVGGTAPWWWTELFGGKAPRPASPTPPPAAVKYVVTERNPFSGGVENAREFAQADHPAFTRCCMELHKTHWVSWRYVGIYEPLRSRRFPTRQAAQRFIDDRGPQNLGAVPAFTALGEAAAIVAARVACDTIVLPAAATR